MICEIISKERALGSGCEFEYWNIERHELGPCGKTPIANVGGHLLCIDCLPDALIHAGSGTYFGATSSTIKGARGIQLATKEDFLSEAKWVAELRSKEPVKA